MELIQKNHKGGQIKMIEIFIGIAIGIVLTLVTLYIRNYLRKNHLKLNTRFIIGTILIVYLIYSFIGIIVSPEYTKPNGNVCKGFNYGINVCSGDIDAE